MSFFKGDPFLCLTALIGLVALGSPSSRDFFRMTFGGFDRMGKKRDLAPLPFSTVFSSKYGTYKLVLSTFCTGVRYILRQKEPFLNNIPPYQVPLYHTNFQEGHSLYTKA
jgi:hypothetical protein